MKKLILVISIFAVFNLSFTVNKCTAQWTPTNYPSDVGAYSIIKYGSNLFAGTYGHGIYKSSDNGMNWTQAGLNYSYIFALASSGPYILAGTEGYGIFVSSDYGTTWIQASPNDIFINCILIRSTDIYTGTDTRGIYRSTDNGYNWSQTSLTTTTVYSLAANDSYIFAGGNGRVRRSSDNGASYVITMVGSGLIGSLVVSGPNIFAGTANFSFPNGIYVSTNDGTNWTQTSLNDKTVLTLCACETNILASTYQYGVYLSTDNGINWVQKNEGLPVMLYYTSLYDAGEYLFIAIDNAQPLWRRLKSEIFPSTAPVLVSPENNSVIETRTPVLTWESVSGTAYYNLKVSTDAGFSSLVIDLNNITDTLYNVPAAILQDSTTYFWKVSAGSGGWSDVWQFSVLIPITPGYTIEKITSLTNDIYNLLSEGVISSENAEMLLSKLNNTIIQINLSHYEIAINRIEQFIFGVNLLKTKNILTQAQADPLLSKANEIIYMLNFLNGGDNLQKNLVQEKQFYLEQNYPNPFNPVTQIKFGVPVQSLVKITLFDVLGREFSTVVNRQFAPGYYNFEFDGSNYPSGVYFYRITAASVNGSSSFVETRKMLMIK